MKQSLKEWFWFAVIVLGIWTIASLSISNALICPTPWQVSEAMMEQIQSTQFLTSIGLTIARSLWSLLCSFVFALAASFLAAFYPVCRGFLNRLVSLMQTVPNVCYIILLLFWTSREQTVILTGFFLLFPLIYRTVYEELRSLQKQYREVWAIYPQPAWTRMFIICFPMLKPAFLAALKSASSLAFKVCVTSEILTGLPAGIGKSLQVERLAIHPAGVIGWSIWLILIVFAFEKIWKILLEKVFS